MPAVGPGRDFSDRWVPRAAEHFTRHSEVHLVRLEIADLRFQHIRFASLGTEPDHDLIPFVRILPVRGAPGRRATGSALDESIDLPCGRAEERYSMSENQPGRFPWEIGRSPQAHADSPETPAPRKGRKKAKQSKKAKKIDWAAQERKARADMDRSQARTLGGDDYAAQKSSDWRLGGRRAEGRFD